jgi:hypothetical protein
MLHKNIYISADINTQPSFLTHNRYISNEIVSQTACFSVHGLTFNGIHSVISQKTILFVTIGLRTSNPTVTSFAASVTCCHKKSAAALTSHSSDSVNYPEMWEQEEHYVH